MTPGAGRVRPVLCCALLLPACMLAVACGDSGGPRAGEPAAAPKLAAVAPAPATPRPVVAEVDACSLLSAAEVAATVGRKTTEPVEDHSAGHMSICAYPEPGARVVAGMPQAVVAKLTVVAGSDDYFQGPTAQVAAIFDMAVQSGAELEEVGGIGERAHWSPDSDTLRVLRGPYMVEVEIPERDMAGDRISGNPREIAERIATTMLSRLP